MCDNLSSREPCSFENQGVLAIRNGKRFANYLIQPEKFSLEFNISNVKRWSASNESDQQVPVASKPHGFTDNDWARLKRIHDMFNDLTLFISNKRPQISLTVPIYCDIH
ncbi:hypothetical protein V1523DRAFT_396871 [Lipomyces doorenjongii]